MAQESLFLTATCFSPLSTATPRFSASSRSLCFSISLFGNCLQAVCKNDSEKGNLFTLFVFDPGGSLTSTHCVCKILPKIFAFDRGGLVELIIKVFAQSIEDNCCKMCS